MDARQYRDVRAHRLYPGVHDCVGAVSHECCRYGLEHLRRPARRRRFYSVRDSVVHDKVDGYLARSRNEITDFGKFLDPIADKLLVFSALLLFLDFGAVTVWSVFIILFRELLVSALRMVASAAGVVVAADKLGKYKTATTMVSICGYLCVFAMAGLHLGPVALTLGIYSVSRFLYAVAVVLTVISGAQYFWNCRKIVFSV